MKKINFIKSNVNKNELKRSLITSIQKNEYCIDFLKGLETKYQDIVNYTDKRSDEICLEVVQWILFNMNYNTDMFKKVLKENGGNPDAIKPFEWE